MPFDRADRDEPVAAAPVRPPLSVGERAQVDSLRAVRDDLAADARSWAHQLTEIAALAWRAQQAGGSALRELPMELAGSWHISQLTAERWIGEAERFTDALPLTLALLGEGRLFRHQAVAVRQELDPCTPEIASKVEAEVLPAGAELCPTDLRRQLTRVRLRLEAEQLTAEQAEAAEAEKVGRRRTWTRPTEDGLMLAGAVLTPEQGVAWAQGMDDLERRERLADAAAGVVRTAEQRRADLFASLPAIALAGMACDDRWRAQADIPGGRTPLTGVDGGMLFDRDQAAGPVPPQWALTAEQIAAQITLNIHVPVATILGLSQQPGTLDRYGPVSAQHVRLVRPKSYRRIMVDATSGRPIAVDDKPTPAADTDTGRREQIRAMLAPALVIDADEPQHDPSARLARLVDIRDRHCCGPGCSSSRYDRDHLEPYARGGKTNARNLGPVSRRCHNAKTTGRWILLRHNDGSVTWHSALHQTYRRPGPWTPPPKVDIYAEPPPRRPQAKPAKSEDDAETDEPDVPISQRIRPPEPQKPPAPENTHNGWNDDPPF
ncbi:MAG: HNH endonuclease [Frankiales bacterium]|nr:MAG: HNH endonuclease [Frankiales bacterium]